MAVKNLLEQVTQRQMNKQWAMSQMAERLRSVREDRGLTQRELADRVGLTESAIRNYELMQASPKRQHLDAIAAALDIRPEALVVYDLADHEVALNVLFQIADTYGLEPVTSAIPGRLLPSGKDTTLPCVKPSSRYMEEMMVEWAYQYDGCLQGHLSIESYRAWQDAFAGEYELTEFPDRCETSDQGKEVPIEPWHRRQMAAKIKGLRVAANMSQEELARQIGVSVPTLRTYEQAKHLPKERTVAAMASTFGVTLPSLSLLDLPTPTAATHVLFQIADQCLYPCTVDGSPILWPYRGGLLRELSYWTFIYEKWQNGRDESWYDFMRDHYDEDDSNCGIDLGLCDIPFDIRAPHSRMLGDPFKENPDRPRI
jgi:transcriptional regulator with XRE-family HTH domain